MNGNGEPKFQGQCLTAFSILDLTVIDTALSHLELLPPVQRLKLQANGNLGMLELPKPCGIHSNEPTWSFEDHSARVDSKTHSAKLPRAR